ncbi:heavy-metal-associated domain-containing protein [Roseomonas aerophila]|uniref:Heavy-metal-associated domain-containing protein n=1 Tax=Teichococcus aerophilus TaxID=1224513 RepID=A0ABR7RLK1_9PROT|nr:heavy-metal-associated domain-containing protein [Pseudoroseomonas aerophila]MBC9207189.1 heavy-metal-associated domain-containing protein [Pseudoroseomonas aerophila]
MSETIELTVRGMDCAHCVRAVTQAIQAGDPAAQVAVDLASGKVRATTSLPRDRVETAIREEGYDVAA